MKYIIYCRKSSQGDSRQAQSLDTQQRLLLNLAKELNLDIIDIIRESMSAKTDQNRPLFTNMLDRVRKGEANAILVVHVDRLARNGTEADVLSRMIETGVLKEIRTIYTVFDSVASLMHLGHEFLYATQFSRDLSIKIKTGNESKLLKGGHPGPAPVGYVNIKPGIGIEPDPIRAPFVTKAFELFATGEYSVKTLAKKLNDDGFRSKAGNKQGPSTIHKLLNRPTYYGLIKRNEKLYPGNHKPLISKEIFDIVQKIFTNKSRPRKQKHNFVFKGPMICGECGCKITAGISKGQYIYYRCTNGKGNCSQHKTYYSKQKISDVFKELLDDFTLDPERAIKSFNIYKESKLKEKDYKVSSNNAIKNQSESIEKKLAKLEDMYLEERISPERYDKRKLGFSNELAELQVLLKQENHKGASETLELVEEIKNNSVQLSKIFEEGDDQVKKDLLKSVLWNCEFKDGKITSTRLTELWKPLENLNKTDDLENWWT